LPSPSRSELAILAAQQGMDYFLRNFSHVPDDRLNWTPSPTSKSALRIAAHAALQNFRFAEMIANKRLPEAANMDQQLSLWISQEVAITSRAEVEHQFTGGIQAAVISIQTLSQSDLDIVLESGQGWSVSMAYLITLPGWHATLHAGQIDYLQTCWDDQEIYVE
jgi:hypothetical protein